MKQMKKFKQKIAQINPSRFRKKVKVHQRNSTRKKRNKKRTLLRNKKRRSKKGVQCLQVKY